MEVAGANRRWRWLFRDKPLVCGSRGSPMAQLFSLGRVDAAAQTTHTER
jgi:hypothetical protein